jgi:hypothetical protein
LGEAKQKGTVPATKQWWYDKKVYAMAQKYVNYTANDFSSDCQLSKVRWNCWGADMWRQSRIESFMVKLYILLDTHLLGCNWLTS